MKLKTKNTGYVLYVVALALIICWSLGFFGNYLEGIVHLVLILLLLLILFGFVKKRDALKINRSLKGKKEQEISETIPDPPSS